jgi:nicotinate phosphoribosyltransferase
LYWETVTEELGFSKDDALRMGRENTEGDVQLLLRNAPGAQISLFGARRRYSGAMEDQAHEVFLNLAPQLLFATSTVGKGITYDLRIGGTNAHELVMVLFSLLWAKMGDGADLGEVARVSQLDMLDKWWDLYGYDLSIGLTDTYGTNFFLEHLGEERALRGKGFRQDSGDPLLIGQKYLAFYEGLGIDAREKTLLFTDGLVRTTIEMLWREFGDKAQVGFGWGTGATNNAFPNDRYYRHASMVMKAVAAGGMPNAKITDNPMKAAGDPQVAERLKAAIGHVDGPAITPVF